MSLARHSIFVLGGVISLSPMAVAQTKGVSEAFFKREPNLVARECVERAMALKGGKSRVLAQAGRAYLLTGDRAKAEALFQQVNLRDAESARWVAQAWLEAGEPKRAEVALVQMPNYGWGAKEELLNAAVLLLEHGRGVAAEMHMNAVLAIDGSDWERTLTFGIACLKMGRQDLAAPWFKKVIRMQERKAEAWASMAEAFGTYASALSGGKGPSDPTTSVLALTFLEEPKDLAQRCAAEAKRLNPNSTSILAKVGATWLAVGDRAKAEPILQYATYRDGNDARVRLAVARAWMRHGTREEGLEAYKLLARVNLAGRFDNLKNVLAWAATDLIEAGFTEDAETYMERSYSLDHDDPNNFIDFGRAAWLAGRSELAATYFARATQAEPEDIDVWLDIAGAALARLRKP